ncbi:MAG: glycoside hydrolase family 26 protein [Clostridiales Family XIII bacterium]|nr:glycoside hydrolase family 26 protein [Clostridiales Family XIII bacterium]
MVTMIAGAIEAEKEDNFSMTMATKAAAVICMVALMSGITGAIEEVLAAGAPADLYSLVEEDVYNRFDNYVDGYSLLIDRNMTVDMRISENAAILENENKRIEIFRQRIDSETYKLRYLNYSNVFLENQKDHFLEHQETREVNGRNVHILQWSRTGLTRVKDDKNHYVCLDVEMDGYIITIFVSSNITVSEGGGYEYLLSSLWEIPQTAEPYVCQTQNTSSARNWNPETRAFYNHYFRSDGPLAWGIFNASFDSLKEYEKKVNYEFPVVINYSSFESYEKHSDLEQRLENAHQEGKTLELTLQPDFTIEGESNVVYDILNGRYDNFLVNYARTIADFEHPVLFRLGNEMNGDWCSYSGYHTSRDPMIFKAFYRYVHGFFRDAGARNVIWVWNPNGQSFPDFEWNSERMYYPGDEYVDVVGMTAYNTGTFYPDEYWQTFTELYDDLYNSYAEEYGQPLMISEFASASMGGDKNQWVDDMFVNIRKYDRIKIAVWWNGGDYDENGVIARSYYIDETLDLVEVFRRHLQSARRDKPPDVLWMDEIYA